MKFNATAMFLFAVSSLAIAAETSERNPTAASERAAVVAGTPVKKAMARSEGEFKLLDRSPRKHGGSDGGDGVDEDEEEENENEDEDEEDGEYEEEDAASTLTLSYAALFAAVGAIAFAN